jgi:hypothetical protein
MLRLVLEQADIEARLENETLQSALGEVPMGWATSPRILIAADREAEGRRILQEFLAVASSAENPYRPPQTSTEVDTELKGLPPIPPLEISRREAWLELAVLMALLAGPNVIDILLQWLEPGYFRRTYWIETLGFSLYVAQMLFLAVCIICRHGPQNDRYGWKFRWSDAAWGVLFWTVSEFMTLFAVTMGPPDLELRESLPVYLVNRPQGPLDLVLMCIYLSLWAYLYELVMRAYLVSRLSSLFQSRVKAILVAAILYTLATWYHGLNYAAVQFSIALAYGCLYVLLPRVWPLAIGHSLYSIRLDMTP